MKIVAATAIAALVLVSACGGGENGSTALYQADVAQFAGDSLQIEGLDYTDLGDAAMSGRYVYSGRASFNMVPDAATVTASQMEDWLSDLEEEDFTRTPDMVAAMELTANFTNNKISGRVHDFRRSDSNPVSGNLVMRDGVITDEYFHYNAALGGTFGPRNAAVDGMIVGDFMGERAEMSLGILGFGAEDNVYVGVFAGAR